MEAYEKICRRYNLVHAEEENNQVFFAASMAAWWMAVDMDTVLTYMTQGDNGYVPGIFHWKGFPSANPSFLRS